MTVVGIDVDAPDFGPDSIIDSSPDAFARWSVGGVGVDRVVHVLCCPMSVVS